MSDTKNPKHAKNIAKVSDELDHKRKVEANMQVSGNPISLKLTISYLSKDYC